MAAVMSLAGCAVMLYRRRPEGILGGALVVTSVAGAIWAFLPRETLERIASITDQLHNGDLNQRVNIWSAGWRAFLEAPLCGHGAGSFVTAARLAPIDTAHNTILSILVEGGLCALVLATGIVVLSVRSISKTCGTLRIALATLIAVWLISSLVGTVGESRTTWLLLAVIALSHRLADAQWSGLEREFPDPTLVVDRKLAERVQ